MARLKRVATIKVPGSGQGANGIIGRVLNVGAAPKRTRPNWIGTRTPAPRPPGNPTGRGTTTG